MDGSPPPAADDGPIELDHSQDAETPGGPVQSDAAPERPSLLRLTEDRCPNCRMALEPEAVVCFSCGYDLRTGNVVRPKVGVVEVEPEGGKAEAVPEFVTAGRGSARVVAAVGVGVLVAAVVTAGAIQPAKTFWTVVGAGVLLVQQCLLHTGTGLVGVWVAAKVVGERFERHVDLAAARMFLAFAAFMLVRVLRPFPDSPALSQFVMLIPAAGVYWLTLLAVFRKSRQQTTVLAVSHLAVWVFVEFGVQLQAMIQSSIAAK